jgi:hypothetical protein
MTAGELEGISNDWQNESVRNRYLGEESNTHTLAIAHKRIHSAAVRSPANPSSAIHAITSSRRVLSLGSSESPGNILGTIVIGMGVEKKTCNVGT